MSVSLLFFHGTGPASAFIRWWTKSKFAHVAPCIDGALIYDAFWSQRLAKRVMVSSDADAVRKDLPGRDPIYWQAWLDAQVGKPYDRPSIFIIGLTKRSPKWLHVYVSRQGEWICSRLACVVAGLETEAWGLNGPPSPEDIYEMVAQKSVTHTSAIKDTHV